MYVLCVSNPAVAAKSNKPLLYLSLASESITTTPLTPLGDFYPPEPHLVPLSKLLSMSVITVKQNTEPVAECLDDGAANSIINFSVILLTCRSWADFATADSNRI